jgi:hypothetical protein
MCSMRSSFQTKPEISTREFYWGSPASFQRICDSAMLLPSRNAVLVAGTFIGFDDDAAHALDHRTVMHGDSTSEMTVAGRGSRPQCWCQNFQKTATEAYQITVDRSERRNPDPVTPYRSSVCGRAKNEGLTPRIFLCTRSTQRVPTVEHRIYRHRRGRDDERNASREAEEGHSHAHRLHAATAAIVEAKRPRSRSVSTRERPVAGAVRFRDRRAILRYDGAGEADADAHGA